jgi:hypothetical protein
MELSPVKPTSIHPEGSQNGTAFIIAGEITETARYKMFNFLSYVDNGRPPAFMKKLNVRG